MATPETTAAPGRGTTWGQTQGLPPTRADAGWLEVDGSQTMMPLTASSGLIRPEFYQTSALPQVLLILFRASRRSLGSGSAAVMT
jgi:hypothetical protein